jgi:hypothetical protein
LARTSTGRHLSFRRIEMETGPAFVLLIMSTVGAVAMWDVVLMVLWG